jgi:hypothetical protein
MEREGEREGGGVGKVTPVGRWGGGCTRARAPLPHLRTPPTTVTIRHQTVCLRVLRVHRWARG